MSGGGSLRDTSPGGGRGDIGRRKGFLGGVGSRAESKGLVLEGRLRLILHTVDGVWGTLRPAVPRQDVFEVAGLEFHVLKKI